MSAHSAEAADASAAVASVAGRCAKQASKDMAEGVAAAPTSPRATCSTHSHAATSDNSAMTDTAVHSPDPITPFHDGLTCIAPQQQQQQAVPLEQLAVTGSTAAAAAAGVCADSSLQRAHSAVGPGTPAIQAQPPRPLTAVKLPLRQLGPLGSQHSDSCDAERPIPSGGAAVAAACQHLKRKRPPPLQLESPHRGPPGSPHSQAAAAQAAAAAGAASLPTPQRSSSSRLAATLPSAAQLLAAAQVVAAAAQGNHCPGEALREPASASSEQQVAPLTDDVVQGLLRKGVTQLLQRAAKANAAAAVDAAANRAAMPPPPPRPASKQQRALQQKQQQQEHQVREGTRAVDEWLQQLTQQQKQQQAAAAASRGRQRHSHMPQAAAAGAQGGVSGFQPDPAATQLLADLQEFWHRTGCVPVACGSLQGLLELSPTGQYRVTFAHQGRAVTHDMSGFMSAAGLPPSTEWMDAVTLLEVSQQRGAPRAAPCRPITVREAIQAWAAEMADAAAPSAAPSSDRRSLRGVPAAAAAAGGSDVEPEGLGRRYGRHGGHAGQYHTQRSQRWGQEAAPRYSRGWIEGAGVRRPSWQSASEWPHTGSRQPYSSGDRYRGGWGSGTTHLRSYSDPQQEQVGAYGSGGRSCSPPAPRRPALGWQQCQRLERIRRRYLESSDSDDEPRQPPPLRQQQPPTHRRRPATSVTHPRLPAQSKMGAGAPPHVSRYQPRAVQEPRSTPSLAGQRSSDGASGEALDRQQQEVTAGASEGVLCPQPGPAEQQDPPAQPPRATEGQNESTLPSPPSGPPAAGRPVVQPQRDNDGHFTRRSAQAAAGDAGSAVLRAPAPPAAPAAAAPPGLAALDLEALAAAWVRQRLRWRGPIDAVLAREAHQRWTDFQEKLVAACRAQLEAQQQQLLRKQQQQEEENAKQEEGKQKEEEQQAAQQNGVAAAAPTAVAVRATPAAAAAPVVPATAAAPAAAPSAAAPAAAAPIAAPAPAAPAAVPAAAAAAAAPMACGPPKTAATGGLKRGRSHKRALQDTAGRSCSHAGTTMRPAKRLAIVVLRSQGGAAHPAMHA